MSLSSCTEQKEEAWVSVSYFSACYHLHTLFMPHSSYTPEFFSLSVTHTYNICMQSHRDIIELCLGLPGPNRTNFTLMHKENNWLSCYLETYYVPFNGEANTLTLAIICFSTHIQMCACIYTYKYICTDIKGSWSFPLQQDYSINHWAEWPNTIPLYVMWERILSFLQIKNRFLVSLSCSEKIKSKFACGSTNCWVGTVLTLWKYFWNVHRWKSSDSWGK